jgi:hypothetical protein
LPCRDRAAGGDEHLHNRRLDRHDEAAFAPGAGLGGAIDSDGFDRRPRLGDCGADFGDRVDGLGLVSCAARAGGERERGGDGDHGFHRVQLSCGAPVSNSSAIIPSAAA